MPEMQTLAEFRPSPLDYSVSPAQDNGDWKVTFTQSRDSDVLTQSNFVTGLALLGGEGADVRVQRFSHWLTGWVEVVTVRPGSEAADKALELGQRLQSYPVLDEEDLSQREYDGYLEDWKSWAQDDFLRALKKKVGEEVADRLDEVDGEKLREWFESHVTDCALRFTDGDLDVTKTAVRIDVDEILEFLDRVETETPDQGTMAI